MESEINMTNKKRKNRKALIIAISVGAIVVIGCGLLLARGPRELLRAKAECKTCHTYPAENHFGLTQIYVGGDFITVVVNADKVDKYSEDFSRNLGVHKPKKHSTLDGSVYANFQRIYPDTLSVFRCGSSYVITSRFTSSSENIVLATSWHYGNYSIGPFAAPILEYGEYGGEWSHTYRQVFMPDQGVFGPIKDKETIYEFGPGEEEEPVYPESNEDGEEISEGEDAGKESNTKLTGEENGGQTKDEQKVGIELPDENLKLFENCAMYIASEYSSAEGNLLSSKEYNDILDFLFYLQCDDVESVQEFDFEHETMIHRISYDDWKYILTEVYKENDPEAVADKLGNCPEGEMSVYLNSEDGYIYQEACMVSLYQFYTEVQNITENENGYVITYDVYSVFTGYEKTVKITVLHADNKYGYSLDKIEF